MSLRTEAEELFSVAFDEAEKLFPATSFVRKHSVNVAKCAEAIVKQMHKNGDKSLDVDMAYTCGLLHDIGKTREEWFGLNHPVGGHQLLTERGEKWKIPARITMAHTYYGYKTIDYSDFWERFEDEEKRKFTIQYLEKVEIDDYDRLIQLVDNMASHRGVMSISDRFSDILVRHNLKNAGAHLRELYGLKVYFDEKCGMNIYELFKSDIIKLALEEPNNPCGFKEEL